MVPIIVASSIWSSRSVAACKTSTAAFAFRTSFKRNVGLLSLNQQRCNRSIHFHQKDHVSQQSTPMSADRKSFSLTHRFMTHGDNSGGDSTLSTTLSMENIYTEWTLDDDKMLYENINEPIHKVASILGRGLNGVVARTKKLKDVNSMAYQRLFVGDDRRKSLEAGNDNQHDDGHAAKNKLVPVSEVMKRIKWDHGLDSNDFTVQYFDRVDEQIYDCPFDQKNDSVKGKEEMFVFAIPEHRIMSIKYQERMVWDKENRLDCVFGSMNGNGVTIYEVMETYEQWRKEEEDRKEFIKKRQRELANQIQIMLGDELFNSLRDMSKSLQDKASITDDDVSDHDVTTYVNIALSMFRKADSNMMDDWTESINEVEAMHTLSDLVALLPDQDLRERILLNIYQLISKLENEKSPKRSQNQALQPLNENELSESFVRGSGAGGQKINKTANKVVLVHLPTQINVECQETRSLQQNRKIARKRLQLKLDQHYNGVSSRTEIKVAKKVSKKAKAKARNKARLRKKKEATERDEEDSGKQ
jgi:uncharacterized protein (UPF0248 family)